MVEIAKARLLGAEIHTHISITLDAINLDTSSYDIYHTRSDQLLGATRILLASWRLREYFYQIPSFNRMYPFCLTLDERQSIGQKRTGRRAKQQPTGKPIVPQPERHIEISPTTEEVRDCPSEEEGGDGEVEEEPAEQGKGNWISNSTLPFKGFNHC